MDSLQTLPEDNRLPQILKQEVVAQSRLFTIHAQALRFQNGEQRTYECLLNNSRGAVLIIPLVDEETMLLIREYAAGLKHYELGFPKGKIDEGETWKEAAIRESAEEIGLKPNKVTLLDTVSLAAGYMSHQTHIVLAEDFVPCQIEGDEPEPLEVINWPLNNWKSLLEESTFTEGRAYAALLLLLNFLKYASKDLEIDEEF
jgi:ADP-ribose diphosphatase